MFSGGSKFVEFLYPDLYINSVLLMVGFLPNFVFQAVCSVIRRLDPPRLVASSAVLLTHPGLDSVPLLSMVSLL